MRANLLINRSVFALARVAPSTSWTIFAALDSPALRVTRISTRPSMQMKPASASWPGPTLRGIGSPVSAEVSMKLLPEMTRPSRGTRSPGRTKISESTGTSSGRTTTSSPSLRTRAESGRRSRSFLMDLRLRSTDRCSRISPTLKKIITATASEGRRIAKAPPVATVMRKFSSNTRPRKIPRTAAASTFHPASRYAAPNTTYSSQAHAGTWILPPAMIPKMSRAVPTPSTTRSARTLDLLMSFRQVGPDGLEDRAHVVVTQGVVDDLAFPAMADKPRAFQHGKLVAHRGEAHAEGLAEVPNAQLSCQERVQYPEPCRVSEDFEKHLHVLQLVGTRDPGSARNHCLGVEGPYSRACKHAIFPSHLNDCSSEKLAQRWRDVKRVGRPRRE